MAHLAAIVWQKHMRSKNPTQLSRKASTKAAQKTMSLPRRAASFSSSPHPPGKRELGDSMSSMTIGSSS